jgi:hypothetical protein
MSVINWLFEKSEKAVISGCEAVSRKLPKFTIYTEGLPYLTRHYVIRKGRAEGEEAEPGSEGSKFNRWLSVYLHYFHRGDEDAALHNHPWKVSYSLILTNGYVEERWDPKTEKIVRRTLRPGSINRILADDFHRVELIDPSRGAWTLFFSGSRVKEAWGFWWPGVHGFIPWKQFTRHRNAHERPS